MTSFTVVPLDVSQDIPANLAHAFVSPQRMPLVLDRPPYQFEKDVVALCSTSIYRQPAPVADESINKLLRGELVWLIPRGIAEFEVVEGKVTLYSVNFRMGDSTPLTEYSLADSLLRWQTDLDEWLEFWVYCVTVESHTPRNFPHP